MPEHIRTSELSSLVDEVLAATSASIRVARQLAAGAARSVAAPDHRVADIALVTSELATNAIEHGSGSSFRLAVDGDASTVRVAVSSRNGSDRVAGVAPEPVTGTNGRGLRIASSIADSLSIRHDDGTVAVTCTFEISDVR